MLDVLSIHTKLAIATITTGAAAVVDVAQIYRNGWEDLAVKGILVVVLLVTLRYLQKSMEDRAAESLAQETRRDLREAQHEIRMDALREEHRKDFEARDTRANGVLASYIEKMDELIEGIHIQNRQHEVLIKRVVARYLRSEDEETTTCPTKPDY